MKRRLPIVLALAVAVGAAVYYTWSRAAHDMVLTGIVTTDDVVVSTEVQGRLQELSVKEGDTVQRGQLLGLIQPPTAATTTSGRSRRRFMTRGHPGRGTGRGG